MMNLAQQVNILSPEFKSNPFPILSRLRAEHAVCRVTLPDKTPVWLVTRYEDVKTLLTDERPAAATGPIIGNRNSKIYHCLQ